MLSRKSYLSKNIPFREMVIIYGRNGYGSILSWAEMVMGRNDQLPLEACALNRDTVSLAIQLDIDKGIEKIYQIQGDAL